MTAADAQNDPPAPPELVAPTNATVVDGRKTTFAWHPSEGADRYRLQVAKTAQFEELVIDENVGDETAVTVGNQLPTDDETFFWRVRAGSASEWGEPSAVESLIAGTAEEAEQDLAVSSESGPVTGLARAATRQVTRQVFEFADQFEQEKERGVAYEGIAASQIMAIAGSILIVIMTAVVVLFGWYGQVTQDMEAEKSNMENYELRQELDAEAQKTLSQYGVVDEEKGVYRIPIDEAMDVVATEEYKRSQSAASNSGDDAGEATTE